MRRVRAAHEFGPTSLRQDAGHPGWLNSDLGHTPGELYLPISRITCGAVLTTIRGLRAFALPVENPRPLRHQIGTPFRPDRLFREAHFSRCTLVTEHKVLCFLHLGRFQQKLRYRDPVLGTD